MTCNYRWLDNERIANLHMLEWSIFLRGDKLMGGLWSPGCIRLEVRTWRWVLEVNPNRTAMAWILPSTFFGRFLHCHPDSEWQFLMSLFHFIWVFVNSYSFFAVVPFFCHGYFQFHINSMFFTSSSWALTSSVIFQCPQCWNPSNSGSDFHFSRARWSWKESDIPVFKDSHGIPLVSQPAKVIFVFRKQFRERNGWLEQEEL